MKFITRAQYIWSLLGFYRMFSLFTTRAIYKQTLHIAFGFKFQCNITVHNHERRKGSFLKYFRRIVDGIPRTNAMI